MQRVLVTGCGIGNKIGVCDACNLDFSWLFNNVSTILWADKICLPKDLFEESVGKTQDKYGIAVSIMLEELKDHNVIELLGDKQFDNSPDVIEALKKQIANDVLEMEKVFPEAFRIEKKERNNHLYINVQDQEYCIPYIGSIYASLLVADEIGAHCLFSDHAYTFLKYKTGLDYLRTTHRSFIDAYNNLFSFILPDEALPHYLYVNEKKCINCVYNLKCASEYERKVMEYIRKIIAFRNYDELYQLRDEIDKIVAMFLINKESFSTEEVKEELLSRQSKINKMIHRRFEQAKRWINIASIVSIPATIINVSTGNNTAAIASAAVGGAAKAVEKAMEIYTSRKKWVGFLQKHV